MKLFHCRYRDPFGSWRLKFEQAIDADAAREQCARKMGNCVAAWLV